MKIDPVEMEMLLKIDEAARAVHRPLVPSAEYQPGKLQLDSVPMILLLIALVLWML